MKNSEKQILKKRIKRLGLFLLIVFLPLMVVSTLMAVYVKQQWLNIFVCVLILFILFFIYLFLLDKMDKKKETRLKGKKDPFSD